MSCIKEFSNMELVSELLNRLEEYNEHLDSAWNTIHALTMKCIRGEQFTDQEKQLIMELNEARKKITPFIDHDLETLMGTVEDRNHTIWKLVLCIKNKE